MPATHRLHVLGTTRVLYDSGQDVGLPLGKPLAALCFIGLEGSRVTRDELAAVLWPNVPSSRGRASVRQALWLLRTELGATAIQETDGELLLGDSIDLDLDPLGSALSAGAFDEAWERWNGGPLKALSVPDAPRWNAWAEGIRIAWERRMGDALEAHAATLNGDERVRWLQRARQVRPYREGVHIALLQALLHERRLEEAEAARQRALDVVDERTPGVFEEVEDRIRVLRREAFQTDQDEFRLEFVGRGAEFSELSGLWRSVRSGRMRVAGVLGPAGIGKTRLVDQVVALAEAEGGVVVEAKGVDSDRAVPLGTISSLAKQLLRLPGAAGISSGSTHALCTVLPSEDRNGAGPRSPVSPAALADAMGDLVTAVAHEGPLVLRVEDAHWVDRTSIGLILRIARTLHRVPVLIVLTCRTHEGNAVALKGLRQLGASGNALVLTLGPLTQPEVVELLTLSFAFDIQTSADACATRLHRASGGNPLFLLELLRHLQSAGLIRQPPDVDDGQWSAPTLKLPEVLELPHSVREALDRRLAGVGEDTLLLGATLAESETALTVPELGRRSGLGEVQVTKGVTELLRRDLAGWTREDRLQLAHDTLRERLRELRPASNSTRSQRWAPWLVAAAAIVALLSFAVGRPGMASSGPSFGDGLLFFEEGRHLVGYRLQPLTDGRLVLQPADTLRLPPLFQSVGSPVPLESGGWAIPAIHSEELEDAPDAWVIEDGTPRELWAEPGDDRTSGLASGTGPYLINSQASDTAAFRMDLYRLDAAGGVSTLLGEGMGSAVWSRDGSLVLSSVQAPWDTIVALRPDGRRLHALPAPDAKLVGLTWCEGRGEAIGLSLPLGQPARAWSWRPGDGQVQPLDLKYPPSRIECSPDGRALAYRGWVGQEMRLVLEEADGEGVWIAERASGYGRSYWVGTAPAAAPRRVDLTPDSLVLHRGQRVSVQTRVAGVTELDPARGEWVSSDPLTASVSPRGEVIGNGPGQAVVEYLVDGWLSDSVTVRVVESSDRSELLFADPLDRLDERIWSVEGYPTPTPVRDERGLPVLSMNGDGRFTDGIVTHEAYDLSQGATAEIDFLLPLTRVDRQRIQLCLRGGSPLPRGSNLRTDWDWEEAICFGWPADDLDDFDPGMAVFRGSGPPLGFVPVGGLMRGEEWNRVSIQLFADGRSSVFLNGDHVYTLPWRTELEGKRWHLTVFGRAADTQLLVRNVTLWGEPRYEVPHR